MSQENVEVVRRSNEAFLSGDLDAALEYLDPQGEFVSRFGAMEGRVYRGYDEMREYLADIDDAWETFQRQVEELIEVGDAVVAVVRITARSRGGIPMEERIGLLYELRDARITRMVSYSSVDEAVEAARTGKTR